MRFLPLAVAAMACVEGAKLNYKEIAAGQNGNFYGHKSVGYAGNRAGSKASEPANTGPSLIVKGDESPKSKITLDFGLSELVSKPDKRGSDMTADTETSFANANAKVSSIAKTDRGVESDEDEECYGLEICVKECEGGSDPVACSLDWGQDNQSLGIDNDAQTSNESNNTEEGGESDEATKKPAAETIVSEDSDFVSDEPPQSTRRGIREIHSIKFENRKVPKKARASKEINEYRDLDAIDRESEDSVSKTGQLVNRNPSPEGEDLSFMGKVEAKKPKDFFTKDYNYLVMEEDGVSESTSKDEVPKRAQGGYITNYIENERTKAPKLDVDRIPSHKRKKRRATYNSGSSSVKNMTLLSNKTNASSRNRTNTKSSLVKTKSLFDDIADDPSFERLPGEDTATYMKRIYPKLKDVMEAEGKDTTAKNSVTNFFNRIFGGIQSKSNESNTRSPLFLERTFNGTAFAKSFDSTENNARALDISSPLAAMIIIVFLLTI